MSEATIYRYIKPETSPRQNPEKFIEGALKFIKEHLNTEDRVQILLSGGVDSAVTAALLDLEIGNQLYVTHIDTGFMRIIGGQEEPQIIAEKFSEFKNLKVVNARDLFYGHVMNIPDAEEKRLGFRRAYEIAADQQMTESQCNVLAQGTILPDIIETEGGVKSQHNVFLKFSKVKKIVEPVAGLCKDEVRRVAKALWEDHKLKALEGSWLRQPFPGPGLSVRTVGAITPEKLGIEKRANDIVESKVDEYSLKKHGVILYIDAVTGEQIPFQSFAATFDDKLLNALPEVAKMAKEKAGQENLTCNILDIKVTGVREGKRIYSQPLCIESPAELDYPTLKKLGSELPDETQLSRVLYKISGKEGSQGYLIAIRTVNSIDAMKAWVNELPFDTLRGIADEVVEKCGVKSVYLDISPKPPATIEYE
jgi:GMP synthase (glutamine-hydrolysing)